MRGSAEERVLDYLHNAAERRRAFLLDLATLYESEKKRNRVNPGTTLSRRLNCNTSTLHGWLKEYRKGGQAS